MTRAKSRKDSAQTLAIAHACPQPDTTRVNERFAARSTLKKAIPRPGTLDGHLNVEPRAWRARTYDLKATSHFGGCPGGVSVDAFAPTPRRRG
jgi:hypothetical protein